MTDCKCEHWQTCDVCRPMPKTPSIQNTLEERGSRYGTFEDNAALCQELKDAIHARMDDTFTAVHKEALDMICHKIARIVNGDPDYIDSWHDISGYATLVVDHLKERLNG